jgi:hypothetical protein
VVRGKETMISDIDWAEACPELRIDPPDVEDRPNEPLQVPPESEYVRRLKAKLATVKTRNGRPRRMS